MLFNAKSILYKNQFYSKQFSLVWLHGLIVKIFLFQAIQFSQRVLIWPIQFSISIDFVYIQLNVKIILIQTIPFSISTQFKYQNSSIASLSV